MSEVTAALELLAHQKRLIDHYHAENVSLRLQLDKWQVVALQLIERAAGLAPAPVSLVPDLRPADDLAPSMGPIEKRTCATCGKPYKAQHRSKATLCRSCHRAASTKALTAARAARSYHTRAALTEDTQEPPR